MKIRTGLFFAFLLVGLCQLGRTYPQAGSARTGSLVNQPAPSFDDIAAQSTQDYQLQQANALAAARAQAMKAAALDAAAQARLDEAVKKLTGSRDQALAQLKEEKAIKDAEFNSKATSIHEKQFQLGDESRRLDTLAAHEQALKDYEPTDPWRMLDGKLSYAKGPGWVEFVGEVLEVQPAGILMHGSFGPPLEAGYGERDYFVADFPHKIADAEKVTSTMRFNAYFSEDTTYTITNNNRVNGGVHTVRGLQYGTIANPPPELAGRPKTLSLHLSSNHPEIDKEMAGIDQQLTSLGNEIIQSDSYFEQKRKAIRDECDQKIIQLIEDTAKQKKVEAEAKAREVKDRALKFNQEQADKGDPIGLLRMGERYRDGDGVPKNLAKAKVYLQKAADAGSPSAAEELRNLPDEAAHL